MDLNDIVIVILTQKGANVLNEQNTYFRKVAPKLILKTDYKEGDIYTNTLWYLFRNFGIACTHGSQKVFTNLELETNNPKRNIAE